MPFQRVLRRGRLHKGDLVERFLQIIFAERRLARAHGVQHGIRAEGFRDGQQGHVGRGALRVSGGLRNTLAHGLQVLFDCGHNHFLVYRGGGTVRQPINAGTGIINGHLRTTRFLRQQQGFRPAPVFRPAADDTGQRRRAPPERAPARAQGSAQHDLRHHERQPAQGL
ncbi:hypothetical protein D3C72_1507480 [compost metagenome]